MRTRTNLRVWLAKIAILLAMGCTSFAGQVIYVDIDANGLNDGSSWQNAYTFLQDALADANSAEKPVEIWVAEGIYTPDSNSVIPNGTGDREATFQLINNVAIRGGYAGFGEPDPNARDVEAYKTIVSGDLDGNDIHVNDPWSLWGEFVSRAENSYHVVTGSDTDATAILDGLTITSGNANGPWGDHSNRGAGMQNINGSPMLINCTFSENGTPYGVGAGMYNEGGSPTLTNCTFSVNSSRGPFGGGEGGGMYNEGSNPTVMNCTFSNNSVVDGGGMYNKNSSPTVTNCAFTNNKVTHYGGGMCNFGSSPTTINCTFGYNLSQFGGGIFNKSSNSIIINCTFSGNLAKERGGAVYNLDSSPTLDNCAFVYNHCPVYGGGMFDNASSPTLTNCIFVGNSAGGDGGGTCNSGGRPTLTYCTFSGNSADDGGGMINFGGRPTLMNCTFSGNAATNGNALACDYGYSRQENPSNVQLTNCILWDGGDEIWNNDGSTFVITYSDVQGGWSGEGNIDADPCFADPGYWADANDPNVSVEPNNPNAVWIDGDYHLKSQAGRWDPTSESWVKDDVTSPCIDAGDPNNPIGHEPFPNGGIINMGAYGGTVEASKSYFGEPVCETIVAGDINGDCKVDFEDFELMALHWLRDN